MVTYFIKTDYSNLFQSCFYSADNVSCSIVLEISILFLKTYILLGVRRYGYEYGYGRRYGQPDDAECAGRRDVTVGEYERMPAEKLLFSWSSPHQNWTTG